jgi:hypothetical protein
MSKIFILFASLFDFGLSNRFTYLPRCNSYKNLNRRNTYTGMVVDNVLEGFFLNSEPRIVVASASIKDAASHAINAFCEEEI